MFKIKILDNESKSGEEEVGEPKVRKAAELPKEMVWSFLFTFNFSS